MLKFYQRQKKIEPGINSDLQITGSIMNEKYSQKNSPDRSGILLWRGSPQQIQRIAGLIVNGNKNFCFKYLKNYFRIWLACSLVFTSEITSSIRPFSSMINVVLCIPSYSLPINFFGPQTPNA